MVRAFSACARRCKEKARLRSCFMIRGNACLEIKNGKPIPDPVFMNTEAGLGPARANTASKRSGWTKGISQARKRMASLPVVERAA